MFSVRALASWYHEEKVLPYYLSVQLTDPGHNKESSYNSGYSLLFNLRTARLIKMEVQIASDGGNAVQFVPVDLSERCSPQELKGFKDAPR